jgi:osmotically-inducible protein OsmY
MNKKLLILASAGFLACAPFFGFSIFGQAMNSNDHVTVTVQQDKVKSDDDINQAVKNAFASDKDLSDVAANVDVKVDKGVVTLGGFVDNDQQKSAFESKAKTVDGVKTVVNNIEVKGMSAK